MYHLGPTVKSELVQDRYQKDVCITELSQYELNTATSKE